jgi:hypothetical protein
MRILAAFALAMLVCGCGGDNNPTDMSTDTLSSMDLSMLMCGQPGDTGNSKHVGAYCDGTSAYPCPPGTVCASGFFSGAKFCTIPAPCNCPSGMGCVDTTTCGPMTVCVYSSTFSAAGCVPAACAPTPNG